MSELDDLYRRPRRRTTITGSTDHPTGTADDSQTCQMTPHDVAHNDKLIYLTQIINGHERVIGYYSKVLPDACQRYSVTELELFGLLINITAFKHLLRGCEFNAFVDHSSIVQILKSKDEPSTTRLQKLILKLSEYSFKIAYKKGTELVLADFLSRIPSDKHAEIDHVVPISFSLVDNHDLDHLNPTQPAERPVTRASAKKMGISVPNLYPDRPKTNNHNNIDTDTAPPPEPIITPAPNKNTPHSHEPANQRSALDTPPDLPPTTTHFAPHDHNRPNTQKPTPKAPKETEPRLVDKQNESPCTQTYRDVPPDLFTAPKPLISNVEQIVAPHIPKQHDIDKVLDLIKRKIIRDYNLPIDIRRLKTEQETSPFFKPIYDFLAHDILPSDKKAAKTIQLKAEQYILCDGVLFRLFFDKTDDFKLQLAVPESLTDVIISQYHDNLLSNHQGTMRTYLTIRRNYYMPQMFDRVQNYVKACLRCQQFRGKPDKLRPFHTRVPDSYRPFYRISLDFKTMPTSATGFRHLMVICDEITRFVICAPLRTLDAETICEALIQKVICIFGPPSCLVTDAAAALTGKLLTTLCTALNIDRKVISVANHGSLQVERHIRTLSDFLKVNLNQFGTDWVRFIPTTCYAYNSFSSPHLGDHCPYQLVFGRDPPTMTNLTFNPMSGLTQTYDEYVSHLKRKFDQISHTMLTFQRRTQDKQNVAITNKLWQTPIYSVGQLVYLYKPTSSSLTANSRKIAAAWVGPLVVHEVLDRTHFILSTLKGEILRDIFNYNRLKPCFMKASDERKPITHLQRLKEALGKTVTPGDGETSDKPSVNFIDEHDHTPPECTADHIMCFQTTDPIQTSDYVTSITPNNGIAAPTPLRQADLERQFDLLTTAPSDNDMTLHRGRFKNGQLQVLTSFIRTPTDGNNPKEVRFWWNIGLYTDTSNLIRQILIDSIIPVTGTPKKYMKRLYT
ncbi:LOW QUALITY PROTEIN: uncharacterized protein [Diadema setosum]|uniref:LOW QUALITY PROTEIN: uncharacterized protein n=1 Tax=Diadema setosum TaxID=31175 RepID=UPI003B3A178B